MARAKYTCYREDGMWVGWLAEYPDYWTQARTLPELRENLRAFHEELTSGRVPCVRRSGELVVK